MILTADALACLGEEVKPAELQLRVIECTRQIVYANSPSLLGVISESLDFLSGAGRATEGEALARELLAALRSYGAAHDFIDVTTELYTAHFVSMQGRLDGADALYNPLLSRIPDLTKGGEVRALALYGSHLVRCGRFEEAERSLLDAVEITGDVRRGAGGTFTPTTFSLSSSPSTTPGESPNKPTNIVVSKAKSSDLPRNPHPSNKCRWYRSIPGCPRVRPSGFSGPGPAAPHPVPSRQSGPSPCLFDGWDTDMLSDSTVETRVEVIRGRGRGQRDGYGT